MKLPLREKLRQMIAPEALPRMDKTPQVCHNSPAGDDVLTLSTQQ